MFHSHDGYHDPHIHDNGVGHPGGTSNSLRLAFVLSVVVLVVEVAGGIVSNSLAVLSDAGHVFTDLFSLGLAWFAAAQAARPATPRRTFGYHRAGILAALLNALSLVAVSAFITFEAIRRLQSPGLIDSGLMLGVALIGLAVNVYVAFSLHGESGENLNIRSALLHVIGDIMASVAVIAGALVIALTGWTVIDPILSVVIALIIVGGAWFIVLETVNILMEGTPKGINVEKLTRDITGTAGVLDAHDIHVWSLAAGINAMSGHVLVEDQALSESDVILRKISEVLAKKYGIEHATIQFEHRECGMACTLFHNHLASH